MQTERPQERMLYTGLVSFARTPSPGELNAEGADRQSNRKPEQQQQAPSSCLRSMGDYVIYVYQKYYVIFAKQRQITRRVECIEFGGSF